MSGGSLNPAPGTAAGDLSERVRQAAAGTMDLMSIWLGNRLGLYDALSAGACSAAELADRTGTNRRMVREWLEQQAVTGFLQLEPVADEPERRYRLAPGAAEAFTDADSFSYAVPPALDLLNAVGFLPALEETFRTGRGLEQAYGWVEGRPDGNRPRFLRRLGTEWLPAVPEVHRRLSSEPPARIADIGVGSGWSSIAMALAYPRVRVDGFDLDEVAIGFARKHAEQAGVADRVSFRAVDVATLEPADRYDLVTMFEALHDLSQPVVLLDLLRGLLTEGGCVIVADERVPSEYAAPGTDFDRYTYGWSVISCLPASLTDPSSRATGAVMRPDTLRDYALEAGYTGVEVLPVDDYEWRFYRLIP